MIEILPQSDGKTLGVRLTGEVTDEDYGKVFLPALDKLIKEYGKVNCVYYMDEDFEGWTLGAMWDGANFGMKHGNDFEKVAVVGGPRWAEWAMKLKAHFISAELNTFPRDKLDEAWSWIKA